jgi:NADH-quinone oxidoreductase subunit K
MTEIALNHYLIVAAALFSAGLVVVLIKRSTVFVLMGIELMLNAAHINFAAFSRYDPQIQGQVFVVFSIALAASEAAVALAILLNVYRRFGTTQLDELTDLKN